MVGGRFCAKRCGPSCWRAPNPSAVLRNFVRHPKTTFQHYRHEPDMPQQSLYIRCRGQSGRHLLVASISPFDPTETLASPDDNALDTSFCPIKALALAAKMSSQEGGCPTRSMRPLLPQLTILRQL